MNIGGWNDAVDFMNVTPSSLDITEDTFYEALKELEKLGCITNIQWCSNGECMYDDIKIDTTNFKFHK